MNKRKHSVMAAMGLSLAVGLALASLVSAVPPKGDDLLGMYTTSDGNGFANKNATVGSIVKVYVLLTGCTTSEGISGWECSIEVPVQVIGVNWAYGGLGALNVATPPNFAVGLRSPMTRTSIMMLAIGDFMVLDGAPAYFKLHPVPLNPSVPGAMIYAKGNDPGRFITMGWSSGLESFAVFGINTGPVPHADGGTIDVDPTTWGSVKNLYR